MKYSYLFLALLFLSCNQEQIKQLQDENSEITLKNKKLQNRLDSLLNAPAIQFEKLLRQDVLADSLRTFYVNKYVPYYELQKHRTKDSLLIESYLDFAKKNKTSYLSTYALDRISDIKTKRKQLHTNDLVGEWQWESLTNVMFPFKGKLNQKIVFTKDRTVFFYQNNKLMWQDKFTIPYRYGNLFGNEIKFKKQGYYNLNLRVNNVLILTKGRGICMDCGTHIYRKINKK